MGRRMRNLRRGLGLIASCWVLSGTIGLVQAQSCGCEDAGACDCGAPVGVSYSQHVQCCTQKPSGPRAVERMLNSLDRMGNSFERRMASLKGLISLGSDCDSCDLGCDGACGGECASCNEGHASGMVHGEMHFGAWESYAPQSENGSGSWGIGEKPSKESKRTSVGSAESLPTPPPLEKAPVNDHPISTPRGKSKETMPSAIPVPSKPAVPEDWKHNPFQDDARTYPPRNSKSNGIPSSTSYSRAYDPQAYISNQSKNDRVAQGRVTIESKSSGSSKSASKAKGTKRSFRDEAAPALSKAAPSTSAQRTLPNELSMPVQVAKMDSNFKSTASAVRRSLQDDSSESVGSSSDVSTASALVDGPLPSISISTESAKKPSVEKSKPGAVFLLPVPRGN